MIFYDQKALSLNFKGSRSQMFFKIDLLKHFAIFTRKHLCWSYFLIKLHGCRPSILLKKGFNTDVFLECYEIFKNTYFEEHLRTAASVLLIIKSAISTGHLSIYFFNQRQNAGWFLLRRLVDLIRVYSLLIISRNHSNTFSIDLLKTKTCSKKNIAAKA